MTALSTRTSRRPYNAEIPGSEIYPLSNSWQIFDEVIFIIKRNLAGNVFQSFLAATPKFLLIFAIFTGDIRDATTLSILAGLHQIFWRPLVWQSISTSFFAGFPEKKIRKLSQPDFHVFQLFFQLFFGLYNRQIKLEDKTSFTWGQYSSIFFANLITAVPYSGALALMIFSASGIIRIDGLELPVSAIWFLIWCFSLTYLPAIMLQGKRAEDVGENPQVTGFGTIFWLAMRFSMILGILYLVVMSSSVALLEVFGFPLRNGFMNASSNMIMICLAIAADCLIDPFIIGFRLLLTRLGMERR